MDARASSMGDEFDVGYLFLRHPPERADVAVVFGHADAAVSASRARHASNLHRQRLVRRLLLSGGAASGVTPEAEQMAAVCVEAGVPPDDLLLERESTNTFENVAMALRLLAAENLLGEMSAALLVSCAWHMRRVYLTARQSFPPGIRLLCVPHDEGCAEATWRESPDCVFRVVKELAVLERFVRRGLLPGRPRRPVQ
jgi:vancomycin permeability regulator SanA